jgi:hypothetical protein
MVMLSKSRMEDTQGGHHLTRDDQYSLVGLGHILPNRVLTCQLSSLSLCINFHSIKNGRRQMDDL